MQKQTLLIPYSEVHTVPNHGTGQALAGCLIESPWALLFLSLASLRPLSVVRGQGPVLWTSRILLGLPQGKRKTFQAIGTSGNQTGLGGWSGPQEHKGDSSQLLLAKGAPWEKPYVTWFPWIGDGGRHSRSKGRLAGARRSSEGLLCTSRQPRAPATAGKARIEHLFHLTFLLLPPVNSEFRTNSMFYL